MKRMLLVIGVGLLGVALLFFLPGQSQTQTAPQAKIEARILYAGDVGTARQKEFVALLNTYFTQVATTDIAKFQARDADACDVLLIDAEAKEGGTSALDVPNLTLPDNFSKPTVTIGVMGGLFTSRRGLLTGYL